MENELWKKVYRTVTEIARNKSLKRATYAHADIVLTYLWAVLHDRPIYWACKKTNWPIYYRRKPLPNPSTMTRRLRMRSIQILLQDIERILINKFPRSICRWIDAKPLPIGGASKDEQSAFGFGASCLAKGYKLYAVADKNQGFIRWTIKSMQLLTPQRIRNAKGLGHRRNSSYRIRAMELVKRPFGLSLLESRKGIERMFGNLTCFSGGLKPLPHWVRTLFRVRMWVRAKMILYHLWRLQNYERKSA